MIEIQTISILNKVKNDLKKSHNAIEFKRPSELIYYYFQLLQEKIPIR